MQSREKLRHKSITNKKVERDFQQLPQMGGMGTSGVVWQCRMKFYCKGGNSGLYGSVYSSATVMEGGASGAVK